LRELSLHILDLAENSVRAGASLLEIDIKELIENNQLIIELKDNGKGMSKEFLNNVTNPFTTTRTTRKVGLGIPLMKMNCEKTDGYFNISSEENKGTKIECMLAYNHIDRAPMGNIIDTIMSLILYSEQMDFKYTHYINDNSFVFDTREIKQILDGVPLDAPEVFDWLKSYLIEKFEMIKNA